MRTQVQTCWSNIVQQWMHTRALLVTCFYRCRLVNTDRLSSKRKHQPLRLKGFLALRLPLIIPSLALLSRPGPAVEGSQGHDRVLRSREAPQQAESPHWQHLSEVRVPSVCPSAAFSWLPKQEILTKTVYQKGLFKLEFLSDNPWCCLWFYTPACDWKVTVCDRFTFYLVYIKISLVVNINVKITFRKV